MKEKSIKKCALILAGCGAKDGAEITESVSLMIAFDQAHFHVQAFAPNRSFHHVIDHAADQIVESENRNMLVESARIARGNVLPLQELAEDDYDVICFAGGFGVAKNFCNFASEGKNAVLENDVKDILFRFIRAHKIVSALCISPILLALAAKELQLKDAKITLGDGSSEAAEIVQTWGITHEPKKVHEASIDKVNRFVTAPAYMDAQASPKDIFASATSLVKGVESLL